MTSDLTVAAALRGAGLAMRDAQVLLGHVLDRHRAWLFAHADALLSSGQVAAFAELARRRQAGEPIAYLVGQREFWGLALAVSPAVLIPRPETETLVELALACLRTDVEVRALDLGTGSGAIALAIARERPQARLLATDVSMDALAVAAANADRLGLAGIEFRASDWYSAVPPSWRGRRFDLIASNPPYIAAGDPHLEEGDLRFEPAVALSPGGDGLGALRTIVAGAIGRLEPGGTLVVEHGFDQADAVTALFTGAGFTDVTTGSDLAGLPRVVAGCWRP